MKIHRRHMLAGVASTAVLPIVACDRGPSTSDPNDNKPSRSVADLLPTYIPFGDATPDLPENDQGVPAGFRAYPSEPVTTWPSPPGDGSTVTAMIRSLAAAPPATAQNPFWQELNAKLGATLEIDHVPNAGWADKLSVTMASNELPDLIQLHQGVPRLLDFARADLQDLAEFIGGDAVKDYPGLAALPTVAWKNLALEGGLWGIPFPLGVVAADYKVRADILAERGISADLRDGTDFLQFCAELTDADDDRHVFGRVDHPVRMVSEMMGIPNRYSETNGQFTSAYEHEAYPDMLEVVRKMWTDKVITPDAVTNDSNFQLMFFAGKTCLLVDGYTNWGPTTEGGTAADANFELDGLVPPAWNGGGAAPHWTGAGMWTFTSLKKSDPERVQLLLRIMDWLAAPFGTSEYLFRRWGSAPRDHTLDGSDPVPTDEGTRLVSPMQLGYIASGASPLYIPGRDDLVERQHSYLEKMMVNPVSDPTIGLYAPTAYSKGATIDATLRQHQTDIIVGRKEVSTWHDAVALWKSGGGDKIAEELAASAAGQ